MLFAATIFSFAFFRFASYALTSVDAATLIFFHTLFDIFITRYFIRFVYTLRHADMICQYPYHQRAV